MFHPYRLAFTEVEVQVEIDIGVQPTVHTVYLLAMALKLPAGEINIPYMLMCNFILTAILNKSSEKIAQ